MAVEEIFSNKHGLKRRAVASLSEADLEHVEAIARGRIGSPNRVGALEILAIAHGEKAAGTFAETAADESLDPALRAVAVIQLGRVGGPEAERALIELAGNARDASVRLRTAHALAKTASPDALSAFDALVDDENPLVRRRATFARSVLAYRHGIGGFELPVPEEADLLPPPKDEVVRVRSKPAPRDEAGAALADMQRDSYGARLAEDQAYAIDCGSTRMLLVLDASAGDADARDRPLFLGLVAERLPEDGSYSVRWLAFSTPADPALRLSLNRQSGEQVLDGEVHVERGSARFELSAVATVGNTAVKVTGEFADGRVSLSGVSAAA